LVALVIGRDSSFLLSRAAAYIDIKNLRETNVRKYFDGNWWLILRRHKTQV